MQKGSRRSTDDVKLPTSKRPLRHLARFILIGIYSGSRAGAIAAASPIPAIGRSYVDLERGRYYRLKQGSAQTNKRQPTVPIPFRLLAHLRRWHRSDPEAKHFVEYNGKAVTSVKTAFKSAVRLAGLAPGVSPIPCGTPQRLGSCREAQIHGRLQAILECRSRCCSTPMAITIPTICLMRSRKSRSAIQQANEKCTYLVRFLVR